MELSELITAFRKNGILFFGTIIAIILLSIGSFFLQPEGYTASLTLNVSRSQVQETVEYTYDDFYRLQADERFADTVTQWLAAPRIVVEVFATAGNHTDDWSQRQLEKAFSARRLSSQVIAVFYGASTPEEGQQLAQAISTVLNQKAQELNNLQQKDGWFVVLGDTPVITPAQKPLSFFLIIGGIVGLFVAFWVVVIVHYIAQGRNE